MTAHAEEWICTDYVIRDTEIGTGVASILIDIDGDNSIVLVPQANMRLSVEDIERASESIAAADVLLLHWKYRLPLPNVPQGSRNLTV